MPKDAIEPFAAASGSAACEKCNGRRTIRVLGGGGDYEDWPCPKCRPVEFNKPDATECYDGESD